MPHTIEQSQPFHTFLDMERHILDIVRENGNMIKLEEKEKIIKG